MWCKDLFLQPLAENVDIILGFSLSIVNTFSTALFRLSALKSAMKVELRLKDLDARKALQKGLRGKTAF